MITSQKLIDIKASFQLLTQYGITRKNNRIVKEFIKSNNYSINETKIKRLLLEYYLKTEYPDINSLMNYFIFNEFITLALPEHIIFNKKQELPDFLKEEYFKVIKEVKNIIGKNIFNIGYKREFNIPFIKERAELYKSFMENSIEKIYNDLKTFFKTFYPSKISNYYYFESNGEYIEGLANYNEKKLESLKGYELQKSIVVENTKRFVENKKSNNVFLYGARGTGKTSLVKALLEEFKEEGLRIIKVKRDDIDYLINYLDIIRETNYKFIINIDDISYDENELIFKKHKLIIDSFFDRIPKNVVIYATSNSQDIVRFKRDESLYIDRRDDEEKKLEPPQRQIYDERRAFTERFGITVFFGKVEEKELVEILKYYADLNNIKESIDILLKEYKKWVYYHGSINGRTIENFIKYYIESLNTM
ncbi:MAG TPA: DUF815 domain-containing protein [Spirochaetota bacterium]|nr:DUF815 domain-containing protein [Spirochaetota bacterium]HOM38301.1 DUF815 domain-containing protein [Spirochaetota bacterium]HPQ48481.1 DUF815 domain-containing protein [Spirochaetota bacterium]